MRCKLPRLALALIAPSILISCAQSSNPTMRQARVEAAIPPYPSYLSSCPKQARRELKQCASAAKTAGDMASCQSKAHQKVERCLISSEGEYRAARGKVK